MLRPIEEYGSYVEIVGFRNVRIKDPQRILQEIAKGKPSDVEVQLFDASAVATWQHLYFAALNAIKSFENGENMAKTLSMETLLYAASEHQITRATEKIGIKSCVLNVAALIIGREQRRIESVLSQISVILRSQRDDGVLEISKSKYKNIVKTFEINPRELGAVAENDVSESALIDLIIERMALLSTQH